MKLSRACVILSASFVLCGDEISLSDISVVERFADSVMLNIGDRPQLLKLGQRIDQGVLLLRADS